MTRTVEPEEIVALRSFTERGGKVLLHVAGDVGQGLASAFDVKWVETYNGEQWVEHALPESARTGPYGTASTYRNRYESHLVGSGDELVVLAEDGGGPVLVEATVGAGRAVLYTNLFAFADDDWSVGGAGEHNAVLLMNLLFDEEALEPAARVPGEVWAQSARKAQDSVDSAPIRAFIDEFSGDRSAEALVSRAQTWVDAGTASHDPRFFPVDDFAIATTTRKDLRRADFKPTSYSKWIFDLGDIQAVCLEGKVDVCMTAKVNEVPLVFPDHWESVGLSPEMPPLPIEAQMTELGYICSRTFAAVTPFGTQVVAEGYGLRWEFDYAETGLGESNRLIGVTVRAD